MALHFASFVETCTANEYMRILQEKISWKTYAPSPRSRRVATWEPGGIEVSDHVLSSLVDKLQRDYGVRVRGVFLNYYHNGKDYCPYHKDRYPLDVWTLSLGAKRDFKIKRDGRGHTATTIKLESGRSVLHASDHPPNSRARYPDQD